MQTHIPAHTDQANRQQAKAVERPVQSVDETQAAFEDKRTTAAAQRQLQAMADNSPQAAQGKTLQAMMNSGPHAMRMQAFQRMANGGAQANWQARHMGAIPLQRMESEEPLQDKQTAEPTQREAAAADAASDDGAAPTAAKPNNTGLPDSLKSGIESLSGHAMDDVKVHYNSPEPAQLQAHAYAQGTDIHVAPGQEKHLPHEAWHVVQQKQGRVRPTFQMKRSMQLNDDAGLEAEADLMGGKAEQAAPVQRAAVHSANIGNVRGNGIIQRKNSLQVLNEVILDILMKAPEIKAKGDLDNWRKMPALTKAGKADAGKTALFNKVWPTGDTKSSVDAGTDRAMLEILIQDDYLGIGVALRDARLASDVAGMRAAPAGGGEAKGQAKEIENIGEVKKAVFYRAEETSSGASAAGTLTYNPEIHGKKGSAADSPSKDKLAIMARADGNLFVTKDKTEARSYLKSTRELLTIVVSKTEFANMKYDVDSRGYKTTQQLTGILPANGAPTDAAYNNMKTWLPPVPPVVGGGAAAAVVPAIPAWFTAALAAL